MTKKLILLTDRFTPEAIELLKQEKDFEVVTTDHRPSAELLSRAYGLLIRSRTLVDDDLVQKSPALKVVITSTSGFDHIRLSETVRKKICVMYTPMANAQSAAEHTLLLMLSVLRRAGEVQRTLRDGRWKDGLTIGHELQNKTVGIIGLGRVGSRVAKLLQAFGAQVIAHDPYQNDEVFDALNISRMGISEVFSQADIMTFHVPLNSETRRMVRAETLELMQDGVFIINTSRGQVIDEGALLASLDSGEVAGAGLDVFEHEPLARDSRLRKLANVVITPHIGAYTHEAYMAASLAAAEKLIKFVRQSEYSDLVSV